MQRFILKFVPSHTAILISLLYTSLVCISMPTHAEVAQYDDLGRLFSKPEQRQALDAQRKVPSVIYQPKNKPAKKRHVVKQQVKAKPNLPMPAPITMQGYVKRSDGPNTIWINNKPVQENSMVDQVKVGRLSNKSSQKNSLIKSKQQLQNIDQLVIKIPANGKYVKLKAGQGYDASANAVSEITTRARENQIQLKRSHNEIDSAAK